MLGKIPLWIISTEVLHQNLKKFSKILKEDEYKLVIKIDKIFSYLPIVEDQFTASKILIK